MSDNASAAPIQSLGQIGRQNLPCIADTAPLPEGRGIEHWREIFGTLWGTRDIWPLEGARFFGNLHSRRIDRLTYSRIEFGNQKFSRKGETRSTDDPFYSLSFPFSGQAVCRVGDRSVTLRPRHAFLLNNGRDATLEVPESYTTFNVKIPMAELEDRLGWRADILRADVKTPDAVYHYLQQMIRTLLFEADREETRATAFLTNQLLDAVAFFLENNGRESGDNISRNSNRARVLAHIERHAGNPDLSPDSIASACGLSRSYLYTLFDHGQTVMGEVRNQRLEKARSRLTKGGGNLTLTRIALDCGFTSSSEFSRQFKARFGLSPRDYRRRS